MRNGKKGGNEFGNDSSLTGIDFLNVAAPSGAAHFKEPIGGWLGAGRQDRSLGNQTYLRQNLEEINMSKNYETLVALRDTITNAVKANTTVENGKVTPLPVEFYEDMNRMMRNSTFSGFPGTSTTN